MSLVSRKAIQIAGPDKHDETIVTFRREVDKTYTKITVIMSRNWKTGGIKPIKKAKPVEDGPFELTKDTEGYDEKAEYTDIDGTVKFMYFKRVEVLSEDPQSSDV